MTSIRNIGREEDGERIKHGENSKLPFFGHILKYRHIHFLVHGHFSWSTFILHLVRDSGPKGFTECKYVEIGPWKCDVGQLHGP